MKTAIGSITLAVGLLSACASGGMGVMDGIMRSWDGAPLDAVIAQWGYPHGETTIAGRHLYYWDRNVSAQMPATTTGTANRVGNSVYYSSTTSGGGILQGFCRRTLEVDVNNIVRAGQWEGNNCPFAEMGPYANWRRR